MDIQCVINWVSCFEDINKVHIESKVNFHFASFVQIWLQDHAVCVYSPQTANVPTVQMLAVS